MSLSRYIREKALNNAARSAVNSTAFDSINSATGFANGDEFDTVEQVRAYFTPEVQRNMFGWDAITDPVTLGGWAELVIVNGWHMRTK